MRRACRAAIFGAAAAVLTTIIGACESPAPSTPRAEARVHASAAPTPADPSARFLAAVEAFVTRFDGEAGIWLADPSVPAPLYARDPDTPVVAASLYKLAVLLHVESLVERRTLSYRDVITIEEADVTDEGANEYPGTKMTVDEALEAMITYSDNGPAMAFVRLLGAARINATLATQKIMWSFRTF